MKKLTHELVETALANIRVNKAMQRRLTFAPLTRIVDSDWAGYDMIALPTKDERAGILFIELVDETYATAYELRAMKSSSTGRTKPIICDFCKTWQAGGRAGVITFRPSHRSLNSISLLCCLDLRCSLHVRDKTTASKTSRAQLREHLVPEQRILRLQESLSQLTERLRLSPVKYTPQSTSA